MLSATFGPAQERDERVGSVDDVIVTPDKALSDAIINAGGFLGLFTTRWMNASDRSMTSSSLPITLHHVAELAGLRTSFARSRRSCISDRAITSFEGP